LHQDHHDGYLSAKVAIIEISGDLQDVSIVIIDAERTQMNNRKRWLMAGLLVGMALLQPPNTSLALPLSLSEGSPLIAIDGDRDRNVTVKLASIEVSSRFNYGYFLNGSSTFTALDPILDLSVFQGGDIIDLALQDRRSGSIYSLSGDADDTDFEVAMTFGNRVLEGSPQQPDDWTAPYFYNANITWTIHLRHDHVVNTNELAINFVNGGNDGVAPINGGAKVPEPASILLLGSGLVGLGVWKRARTRSADNA
jgi:hypothetical protein